MSPDVPVGRTSSGWMWPDAAPDPWLLAPRLAPQNLVSNANIRTGRTQRCHRLAGLTQPGKRSLPCIPEYARPTWIMPR
jgi:hypothetical protein